MTSKKDDQVVDATVRHEESDGVSPPHYDNASVQNENTYAFDDSRKLGVTGSVFLILNKMIGTGSKLCLPLFFIPFVWNLFCTGRK